MNQNATFDSLFTALRKSEVKGQNLYRVKFSVPSEKLDRYHTNVERQVFSLRQRINEQFPDVSIGEPINLTALVEAAIEIRLAMIRSQPAEATCEGTEEFLFSDRIHTPWGLE